MATIGRFFNFAVFSQDSKRELEIEISLTETGWKVKNGGAVEEFDDLGPVALYKQTDGHRVVISNSLQESLQHLYTRHREFSDRAFQHRLTAIASEISELERAGMA